MSIDRHRAAERGFTLTELLVSLAILGMTASMLLSGLVTGNRAWERIERRAGTVEEVTAAQSALRGLVEHVYPQTSFDASRPEVDFSGDARGFVLFAPSPDAIGPAYPWRYRVGMSQGSMLTVDALNPLAPAGRSARSQRPLLDNVAAVDFAYLGPRTRDGQERWQPRWRGQPALPQAIRVRVAFRDGDARAWPDLIIHPVPTIDTACIFDINTGRCRGRR